MFKSDKLEDILDTYNITNESTDSYVDALENIEIIQQESTDLNNSVFLTLGIMEKVETEATIVSLKTGAVVLLDNLKKMAMKILTVIKDFIKGVMVHIQSTMFKQDRKLVVDGAPNLLKFFEDTNTYEQSSVKAFFTVYNISNPIEEYNKDIVKIDSNLKIILDTMSRRVSDFKENCYNKKPITYMVELFGWDSLNKEVHENFVKLFQDISLPDSKVLSQFDIKQPNFINKLKEKYFGEEKRTEIQPIINYTKSFKGIEKFVTEESYLTERRLRQRLVDTIDKARKSLLELDAISNDLYTQVLAIMYVYYNSLLNILVKIPMIYWSIYNDMRSSTIKCVKAILNETQS